MLEHYIENRVLSAPGLAIGTVTSTALTGNTFAVKIGGIISNDLTTADAPALSLSKGINGAASTNLADGFSRFYSLLATITAGTGAVVLRWVHGADFANTELPSTEYINRGTKDDAVVGFLLVRTAAAAFVPGTTLLGAGTVTDRYFDGASLIGQ